MQIAMKEADVATKSASRLCLYSEMASNSIALERVGRSKHFQTETDLNDVFVSDVHFWRASQHCVIFLPGLA